MANNIITKLKLETSEYDANLAKAKRGMEGYVRSMTDMGGAMKSALSMMPQWATAAGAVAMFGSAVKDNIEIARNFEKAMSGLSAITGVSGAELEKYKDAAIELGGSSTQTASQVVDAFKLIGSQKPELLKSSQALKSVTKDAITLAEAAGLDVPDAAKALTASLNIMGASASESTRYINVLGAASKEGSADIQNLTDIIFKAGQSAKINNLSFEQFIATAETIAPSFGSAAEAGTALNAMLLKLETQTNENFKPSVVGFTTALRNLKDANLSANDATKLVTETGYKALVPILDNIDALEDLQKKITGTQIAVEQAAKNNDNLDGSLKQLDSSWEKLNLTLNTSNGLFRWCVDDINKAVVGFTNLIQYIKDSNTAFNNWCSDIDNAYTNGYLGKFASFISQSGLLGVMGDYGGGGSSEPELDGFSGAAKVDSSARPSNQTIEDTTTVIYNTDKAIRDHIAELTKERDTVVRNTERYRELTAEIEKYQNILKPKKAEVIKKNPKDIGISGLGKENLDIPEIKMPELEIDMDTVNAEIAMKRVAALAEVASLKFQYAANSIAQMGSALQGIDDPAAKVAGTLAEAVATIALSYAMASAQAAEYGPWAWIAFAATGLATTLATIASIKDAGKFAEGGVIGGSSYSGDRLIAHVNSGEAILNQREIGNALSLMDSASASRVGGGQPYVSGEMLVLGINNHLRRIGKGEIVTTR